MADNGNGAGRPLVYPYGPRHTPEMVADSQPTLAGQTWAG